MNAAEQATPVGSAQPRRAVILLDPNTADLRVAGFTLLDRLLVAMRRAGCKSITVVGPVPQSPPTRAAALNIHPVFSASRPPLLGPTLVADSRLLVHKTDLELLLRHGGRLVDPNGERLPVGLLASWPEAQADLFATLPACKTQGLAMAVHDAQSARQASRRLWASLGSASDGLVDRFFNRPAGRPISKLLVPTPVTPNQVSACSIGLGVLAGLFFALGSRSDAMLGAVLLQISAVLDCVDGDLARIAFKESPLGRWLDLVGDQVVHVAVFGGIGWGLYRAGVDAPVGWLTASALCGVALAFGVVLRGLLNPQSHSNTRLQRLIDAATNRDFSVLVLALAALGRLDWFLWMAAVGVHVFWIAAWWLQRPPPATRVSVGAPLPRKPDAKEPLT